MSAREQKLVRLLRGLVCVTELREKQPCATYDEHQRFLLEESKKELGWRREEELADLVRQVLDGNENPYWAEQARAALSRNGGSP